MNPLSWSFRRLYFLAVAACFGSVAYALYVQYGMLMQPCPLCILQRVVFLAMGVFFLAGAIHNPGAFGRKVYAALVGLSAIAGLAVAGRHVAIQLAPADQLSFCGGMGLDYMLEAMPLTEALVIVFKGSGECAKIDWSFLGLSMPMWTLVLYAGLLALAVYSAFKKY